MLCPGEVPGPRAIRLVAAWSNGTFTESELGKPDGVRRFRCPGRRLPRRRAANALRDTNSLPTPNHALSVTDPCPRASAPELLPRHRPDRSSRQQPALPTTLPKRLS